MKITISVLLATALFCFGGWIYERTIREKTSDALEEASNALKVASHELKEVSDEPYLLCPSLSDNDSGLAKIKHAFRNTGTS